MSRPSPSTSPRSATRSPTTLLDDLLAAFDAAPATTTTCARSCSPPRTRRSSPPAATSRASRPRPRCRTSTSPPTASRACSSSIGGLGKPTLCAANGHVLAGALGVALACDLIVAKEGARFGTPEINVGIFPFMIMALIYRNVGRKKTNELLLLGEQIDAPRPSGSGSSTRSCRPTSSTPRSPTGRRRLAAKSPLLMRLGKDAMHRQQDLALADALEYLHGRFTLALSTDDIQEGVKAFFEKREPVWTGRERRRAALPDVGPHRRAARAARRRWRSRWTPTRAWSARPASRGSPTTRTTCADSHGCLLEAGGQVEDMLTAGALPGPDVLGLLDLHDDLPGRRPPRARRPRAVARRARRLQHARDDAERVPRRHVPGRRLRALGLRLRARARARAAC